MRRTIAALYALTEGSCFGLLYCYWIACSDHRYPRWSSIGHTNGQSNRLLVLSGLSNHMAMHDKQVSSPPK